MCSLKSIIMYTEFHLDRLLYLSVSYMPIYVDPFVMYGQRLFIVVLQELQTCLHVSDITKLVSINQVSYSTLPVSEIAKGMFLVVLQEPSLLYVYIIVYICVFIEKHMYNGD